VRKTTSILPKHKYSGGCCCDDCTQAWIMSAPVDRSEKTKRKADRKRRNNVSKK